jgi:uncharacterized membrane protein YjdF
VIPMYAELKYLHLPVLLSFPLLEHQKKRYKISTVAKTMISTHNFQFLPDYDDKNHY